MTPIHLRILLADDDYDDCLFFKEALEKLPVTVELTTVHNGDELMQLLLQDNKTLPHILFLDLNMPRKNGIECLQEIKLDARLSAIPVMMLSTSFEGDIVSLCYNKGAHYYIKKPSGFPELKKILHQALFMLTDNLSKVDAGNYPRGSEQNFVLGVPLIAAE